MTLEIAVNGRPRKVAIERGHRPGLFSVSSGGRTRDLDVSWIDTDTLSLLDGGVSHEVRFHEREPGVLQVAVDGRTFTAAVRSRRSAGPEMQDPRGGTISGGNRTIHAPMPGRIVRLLVSPGDRVTPRQPVVVVEAMKMENELRSPGAGVVREINVREGAVIETGTVLMVIEDAAPV